MTSLEQLNEYLAKLKDTKAKDTKKIADKKAEIAALNLPADQKKPLNDDIAARERRLQDLPKEIEALEAVIKSLKVSDFKRQ